MSHVEVFKDTGGEWRWHRRAGNGEIVATSGEGFSSKSAAEAAAAREHPDDTVVVLPDPEWEAS